MIERLRAQMAAAANPAKAAGMQAYMKSTMPYHGVNLPAVRSIGRDWSTDTDKWKRRVSITCQLGFKRDTDLDLLYANIEPNLADRDFFIRKAIGWALRQYAWTDPQEVARFVRDHEARLSSLSRREALKNIG